MQSRLTALMTVGLVATGLALASPMAPIAADGNEAVAAPVGARSITAGDDHSCAILPSGRVKCWGGNQDGRLGLGDTLARGNQPGEMGGNLPALDLGAGRTATAISAGQHHTCALLDNGTVRCWGANYGGQLGKGDTSARGDQPGEMGDILHPVELGTGRSATAVTSGSGHSCVVLDNGTVKCWGSNGSGQLGQGDTTRRGDGPGEMGDNLPAVDLGTGRTATAITAGFVHTCALLDDGTVKCWGIGADERGAGRLGQGDTTTRGDQPGEMGDNLPAVDLGTGRTATAITAGRYHSCALLDNGTVKCWGNGDDGRLGQGDTTTRGDQPGEMGDNLPAVDLGTGRTATAITADSDDNDGHSCAVLDNGTVKCWGNGDRGRLGQGDTTNLGDQPGEMGDNLPTVDLGTGRTATAVTAGFVHTCAYLDDGTVKCWGAGGNGRLGQGETTDRGNQPGEMGDNLPAVDLGVPLSVRLTADETAVAPGQTIHYHLTLTSDSGVPLTGITIDDPAAPDCEQSPAGLAAGAVATIDCAYVTSASDLGGHANEATVDTDQGAPVTSNGVFVSVGYPSPVAAVTAGGTHSCALLGSGHVKCWGQNSVGQLGLGDTANRGDGAGEMGDNLPTVDLGTGRTATSVSAGAGHTSAILDNEALKCWGQGPLGLPGGGARGDGPGEMGDNLPIVDLGTGRTAVAVAAGGGHSSAILDTGAVKCWGNNDYGQLGKGDTFGRSTVGDEVHAIDLGDGRTATEITAATDGEHTCALLDNARVKCWGRNQYGQLGLGGTDSRANGPNEMGENLARVDLGFGRTALAVSAGSQHTCAILDNGTVKCWGNGEDGRRGSGDTTIRGDGVDEMGDNLPPVDLGAGRTAVAIDVNGSGSAGRTCVLLDNGTVKCWGEGDQGGLGQGDSADRGDNPGEMGDNLPAIDLGAGQAADAISAGAGHACALLGGGAVKCWGANSAGQLGLGDTLPRGDQPGQMGDALPPVDIAFGAIPTTGISGTVCADGGGPLEGAHVFALQTPTLALAGGAVTGPGGTYGVDLNPGTYLVGFLDADHGFEFHDDEPDLGQITGADLVTVSANQHADVDACVAPTTAMVSGTVTDNVSAGPIGGVWVVVTDLSSGIVHAAITAGNGTWAIPSLTPGAHSITVFDPTRTHTPVTGNPTLTPGVNVLNTGLAPATPPGPPTANTHLAGTVTDIASGDPVAGAHVLALTHPAFTPAAATTTAANGTYTLDVNPGNHLLLAFDPTGRHLLGWYDGHTNLNQVTLDDLIPVTNGNTTNANLALNPTTATVSGTVTTTNGNTPIAGAWTIATSCADFHTVATAITAANGTWTLPGLPPGNYCLYTIDPTGTHTPEWYNNHPGTPDNANPVNVGAGQTQTADTALSPAP